MDEVPVARHLKRQPCRNVTPAVVKFAEAFNSGSLAYSASEMDIDELTYQDPNQLKRRVALVVVLAVCLCIPALVLALLLGE